MYVARVASLRRLEAEDPVVAGGHNLICGRSKTTVQWTNFFVSLNAIMKIIIMLNGSSDVQNKTEIWHDNNTFMCAKT